MERLQFHQVREAQRMMGRRGLKGSHPSALLYCSWKTFRTLLFEIVRCLKNKVKTKKKAEVKNSVYIIIPLSEYKQSYNALQDN